MDRQAEEIAERGLANGAELRTLADIREWLKERETSERANAPITQNTPASGMTMGALETIDALTRYLNGDDDA